MNRQSSYYQRIKQLRKLNDQFRANVVADAVCLSPALKFLPPEMIHDIIEQVKSFRNFHPLDARIDEHKLGFFEFRETMLYWHIEYRHPHLAEAPLDPTHPSTRRILHIGLAVER
jgi:hypothetical protein